jgi:hypothetical protein
MGNPPASRLPAVRITTSAFILDFFLNTIQYMQPLALIEGPIEKSV